MEETIVAISTPPGEGGIGVIRLSGSQAISIAQSIFRSKVPLGRRVRHIEYGHVYAKDREIDTGLASVFIAPHSYTGEDTVEISCHGSRLILEMVVNEAIRRGARSAAPGEFTRRAFLNGKLDLVQAEAVVDLIQASSERSLEDAYSLAGGRLSKEVQLLKGSLIKVLALIEVGLDFSEEDIDPISREQVQAILAQILFRAGELLETFTVGQRRLNGFLIALVGKPNAGKSTLLNCLLGEDRAIVTDIPGTTRDLIEGTTIWGGQKVRLVDTAGLRESNDPIESEGINRARKVVTEADVVLFIVDSTEKDLTEERQMYDALGAKKSIVVFNKVDQCAEVKKASFPYNEVSVEISALTGAGHSELIDLACSFFPKKDAQEGLVLTRRRHFECLNSMATNVKTAKQLIESCGPDECVAQELHEAHKSLGNMLGEDTRDELLDSIFADFCIGK